MEARETLDRMSPLPPAMLARNLDDLATIKRWLGYDAALRRWLAAVARRAGAPLTVLDVATGGADVPAMIARRAAGAGARIIGIDLHPQVAAEAARRTHALPQVAIARADALHLPLAERSVDVALCSYTLHHFHGQDARALLRELCRVSRLGLVVADLLRSRAAYRLAWLLLRLWGPGHELSRRDGPLSVRRAYTVPELQQLATEAGLHRASVWRRTLFDGVMLAPVEAFRDSDA